MGPPMRVLHVVGNLGYAGLEAVVVNLYRNMDRTKVLFDFVVVSPKKQRYDDELEAMGSTIHRLPFKGRHPLRYYAELVRVLKRGGYDLIHVNSNSASAALDLLAAQRAGVRVRICHSHNSSCLVRFQHHLLKPLLPFLTTQRLACSEAAAHWMFGRKCHGWHLLRNGIPIDRYRYHPDVRSRVRAALDIDGKLVLGHVGGFVPNKNHAFLIDIFRATRNLNEDAVLLLIGDGPERPAIQAKVNILGLGKSVRFMGAVENVHEFLQAMDILIFPSFFEGLPLALVEAQTAGLPILASEGVPKDAALVDNFVRLPLDTSPEAWAKHIGEMLHRNDRAAAAAIVASRGYDLRQQAAWLYNYYVKECGTSRC